VINPAARSTLNDAPAERIGAIDEHVYPVPAMRQLMLDAVPANVPQRRALSVPYWQAGRKLLLA
jgi:hypothetical protein